jgi:hypothetical protein
MLALQLVRDRDSRELAPELAATWESDRGTSSSARRQGDRALRAGARDRRRARAVLGGATCA